MHFGIDSQHKLKVQMAVCSFEIKEIGSNLWIISFISVIPYETYFPDEESEYGQVVLVCIVSANLNEESEAGSLGSCPFCQC